MKGAPEDVESCAEGVPLTAGCAELAVADTLEASGLLWWSVYMGRLVAGRGHAKSKAMLFRGREGALPRARCLRERTRAR
jgi:hypothetical protein